MVGVLALSSGLLVGLAVAGKPAATSAGAVRVNDLAAQPGSADPLNNVSSVEQVLAKMLRTDGAYRTLSARMISERKGQVIEDVTLAVAQPDRYRVQAKSSDGTQKWTAVSNGSDIWLHHPDGTVEPRRNTTRQAAIIPPTDPRPDRVMVPVSGTDLPIGGNANSMTHPQSVVQGVMPVAVAQLLGIANVSGREGVVLELRPNPAEKRPLQPKFGSRRVYVVDTQTGILLREEQYGPDGQLEWHHELSDVSVDAPEFATDFELKLGPGERLMTPEEINAARR